MLRQFGPIRDAFEINARGCYAAVFNGDVEPGVVLRVGDHAIVVCDGRPSLRATVKGVEAGVRGKEGFVSVLLDGIRAIEVRPGARLMVEERVLPEPNADGSL